MVDTYFRMNAACAKSHYVAYRVNVNVNCDRLSLHNIFDPDIASEEILFDKYHEAFVM